MPEPDPETRAWWRREAKTVPWWSLVVLLLIVAFGVLARWLDLTWRVPLLQAFFPVFGVSAIVLLLAVLALRYRWLALCALVIAIPPAALGMASLHGDTVPAGSHDEIVMTVNLQYGRADPAQVVAAVRAHNIDTLVLQECTPQELAALRKHGLDALLPQQAGAARAGIRGTLVRSTHRLALAAEYPGGRFPDSPDIRVRTQHGEYRLRAVHTPAPLPGIVSDWRAALESLTRWRTRLPPSQRLVMAGDFNASSAMPGFREVADGLTDSSRATGSGWTRTWPHGVSLPPFVQLDHVLTRGFGVVSDGTVTVAGTDHLAYWARLRIEPVTRGAAH